MKKILKTLFLGTLVLASASCSKYLDVNTNPNSPTASTPDVILPEALVTTAASMVTFNNYGAWIGGNQANAGGYGGFGSVLTYTFSTSDNNGLWTTSYNNINDYQYIINNTTATGDYKFFNGIARVMKAFAFIRLVDAYGDVPYSDAVKGVASLTPKYDKAEDIYKASFADINTAIASFKSGTTLSTVQTATGPNGKIDVTSLAISGGLDMSNWVKFANTLKLRMLIRLQHPNAGTGSTVVASMASTYATEKANLENNFITTDFTVQPGYVAGTAGKQNPTFNSYAYTSTGTAASLTVIPTTYAVSFYNGTKINDTYRGAKTYRALATNSQLGNVSSSVPTSPNGTNWFLTATTGAAAQSLGIIKGADAPQPIMLAAESYFLQAEGILVGLIPTGSVQTMFNLGIANSFYYLDKDHSGTATVTLATETGTNVPAYQTANNSTTTPAGYLVNYNLAATPAQQLEAIITQKWIALNFIMSDEAFNEYRRTDYPRNTPGYLPALTGFTVGNPIAGAAAYSIASIQSTISTRADKLPTRILYPASEYSVNSGNAPAGINYASTLIFWDNN